MSLFYAFFLYNVFAFFQFSYFFKCFGLFSCVFLLVDMPCVFNSIYVTIDQAVHSTIAQRSDCKG